MKKFLGLVILGISVCQLSIAQKKWGVGLQGGISIPELRAPSSDDAAFSRGYKSILGFAGGIMAEYKVTNSFSLQSEINFSQQGGTKSGPQRINTKGFEAFFPSGSTIPPFLYATFTNWIRLEYIELPVMGKYSFGFGDHSRISVLAGPYAGYLVSANGEGKGRTRVYTDPAFTQEMMINGNALGEIDLTRKENIYDQLEKLNIGIQGGAMYGHTFGNYEFVASAGGTYGLSRVQKDKNFGNNKTGGATFKIGVFRNL